MGEALLNAVLSRGGYKSVIALSDRVVDLGFKGLSALPLAEITWARDLFIVLAGDDHLEERSFHGRDAPFVQITTDNYRELTGAADRLGVARVVLIAPAPLWEQFGDIHRGLGSPIERALGELSLQRLVVLRPLRAPTSAGRSMMQKFVHFYLSIQMLMVPRSIPTLTSDQVARAAMNQMAGDQPGVTVLSASEIAQALAFRPASG